MVKCYETICDWSEWNKTGFDWSEQNVNVKRRAQKKRSEDMHCNIKMGYILLTFKKKTFPLVFAFFENMFIRSKSLKAFLRN